MPLRKKTAELPPETVAGGPWPKGFLDPPKAFGADREAALKQVAQTLGKDADDPTKPYCTCRTSGGYTFDGQMGIYIHHVCRKPSRLYYAAAVEAGIVTG